MLLKTYYWLFLAFFCVSQTVSAQELRPDFLYGGQLAIIMPGVNTYLEVPVARNLVIRSEVALNLGFARTTLGRTENGTGLTLSGTVSPRWYYNYAKRADLEKPIYRNSANFLSLRTTFIPGVVMAKSSDNVFAISGFTIIPTWGLRRPLGKFVVEASAGLGFRRTAPKNESKTSGAGIDLRLGIGF